MIQATQKRKRSSAQRKGGKAMQIHGHSWPPTLNLMIKQHETYPK